MRRFFLSAAIMAIVVGGPLQAQAGDREIAQQIMDRLKVQRDAGSLKDFTLDLKVDQGVVLLRGSVGQAAQKQSVLAAARGIDGIAEVIDEIEVRGGSASEFSLSGALVDQAPVAMAAPAIAMRPAADGSGNQPDSGVRMATATEGASPSDTQITNAIVSALGNAQRQGQLKGFGVDVNTRDGQVQLNGRASSEAQRQLINEMVSRTAGVRTVVDNIAVHGQSPTLDLQPLAGPQVNRPGTPAQMASNRVPVQTAPYAMNQPMPMQQTGAVMGGGYAQTPVPMAATSAMAGGPRYEQPYLPNYAWPGYAAYPNYAAVSYPQQYSPSAFPYIGPFYPYPQVPLGWRKVSLEWDDGWWYLDFTDK